MALPGDLILDDENLDNAARRVLSELTHVKNLELKQFGAFGDPERMLKTSDLEWLEKVRKSPAARVITVGYSALIRMSNINPKPSSFAKNVYWHPIYEPLELAFDHNLILDTAIEHLRMRLKYYPVGFELLPKKFSISQLQRLYEAILDRKLDKRNFYKKISSSNILMDTGEKEKEVAHKPAKLYKVNNRKLNQIKKAAQLW